MTEPHVSITCTSVVSQDSMWTVLVIMVTNNIDILEMYAMNTYLNAPC